jgi:hypothetical protein
MTIGPDELAPIYRPLEPESVAEFHASRLLILLEICGRGTVTRRIDGRTKIAKLDFFLRYPRFLERAQGELAARGLPHQAFQARGRETEAPMIRYRYGPWDPDYRSYVLFLETRGLVKVVGTSLEGYSLTPKGRRVARELLSRPAFEPIVARAQSLVGNLAEWNGTALKDLIYSIFVDEVADVSFREEIAP